MQAGWFHVNRDESPVVFEVHVVGLVIFSLLSATIAVSYGASIVSAWLQGSA